MSTPSSSVEQARQALADQLRELRVAADLTGVELAAAVGWHQTKVSRLERAVRAPSAGDVRAWCSACGVPDRAEELVAALTAVDSMYVEWRRLHRTGLRRQQQARRPLYERTRSFRSYSSWLIPGLLQTEVYTRAVLGSIRRRRGLPDDLDDAVAARVERQRVLREGDHRFAFVLEESVLRSAVADTHTMAGQLERLLEVAMLPAVSLGVIPAGTGRVRWPVEGFWIFDDDRVNVELVSSYLTITRPVEIAEYEQAFVELAGMAVYGEPARALIREALETGPGRA